METEKQQDLPLDMFLRHVAQIMVDEGVVDKPQEFTDWDKFCLPAIDRVREGVSSLSMIGDVAEKHATAAMRWALSLNPTRGTFRNSYEMYSYRMASSNRLSLEIKNMAASMIWAPQRSASWCGLSESEDHVGRSGERISVKVKLKRMKLIPVEDAGDGPTAFVEFMGENGVLYKWDCYGHHPELPPKGGFFEITGTIKGHGRHGKQLVTAINRVRVKGAPKKAAKTRHVRPSC